MIEKELHKNLKPFLNCIDYTVSKESYEVMINEEYEMLVTSPVPVDLENYYKSEDYISHTDSKKTLFDKVYQQVRTYTLKKKVTLLNSFNTAEKNVLDIGAGTGDFLAICKKLNWKVTGIEPNLEARKIAEKKDIKLYQELSELENQQFDVITLWHVLEHVPNLKEYISQIKNLLKQNGVIVIAVPNYKSFDALYYNKFWAAFDVPRHLWHFSKNSILKLFKKESIILSRVLPMKFDAYYVSLLSEKYKNGKMNPIKAFWIGFKSNRKAKRSGEYSSLIYILRRN